MAFSRAVLGNLELDLFGITLSGTTIAGLHETGHILHKTGKIMRLRDELAGHIGAY
jgi:hypothetical protein